MQGQLDSYDDEPFLQHETWTHTDLVTKFAAHSISASRVTDSGATRNRVMYALTLLFSLIKTRAVLSKSVLDNEQQFLGNLNAADHDFTYLTLDDHLQSVRRSSYDYFLDSFVLDHEKFMTMQKHIIHMYEGVTEPSRIVRFGRHNSVIDCLPITEQPSYYHLRPGTIGSAPLSPQKPLQGSSLQVGIDDYTGSLATKLVSF